MDLSLNETQEMLRRTARDFLTREYPRERVRQIDDTDTGHDVDLWKQMAEMGWTGMIIPEEYGGTGNSFLDLGVLYEEMGRAAVQTPHHSTSVIAALTILAAGTEEQKKQILPAIADGQIIIAFALTEPDYRWEPDAIRLEATRKGDSYLLKGTKVFVHDAHIADKILVVARTNEKAEPQKGITLFMVDRNTPGVSIRTLSGWGSPRLNEVSLESVEVPATSVIGDVDKGWDVLGPVLDKAAIALCSYMVGGGQGAWEMSVQYSQDRIQFGVPIGNFQRIQDHLIDMVNGLDAARWTTYEALWKLDTGRPIEVAASLAKATSSQAYHDLCNSGHRSHGAIGLVKEYGIYLYTKNARTLYAYLGDPAHHQRRLATLIGL